MPFPLKLVPQQQSTLPQGINPPNSRLGQVRTTIQPQSIYTPQMTRYAANQTLAANQALADPRYQMKQFQRPGVSMDEGTLAAAMPHIAQAQLAGRQAAAAIPLQDLFANQQQLLSGQTAREGEGLNLGNFLIGQQQNEIQQRNRQLAPWLSMLYNALDGGF